MAHTELDLRERRAIEDMLNAKVPVSKIAVEIGRHRSTVFREVQRNKFIDEELPNLNGYYGVTAQRSAVNRRARGRKLVRFFDLRQHVIAQLKVAGHLKRSQVAYSSMVNLCASVTRRSTPVFTVQMASLSDWRHLPHRRKKKRHPRCRRAPCGRVFPPDRSIHKRPDYVKPRETFGEWEGDFIIFERAQGKTNVASLVERKTRFSVLFRNNDRSTTHLINKLMSVMEPLPQSARKSITFDRGIEFRNWRKLKPGIGTEDWFRDPQAPWLKGSVENLNKRARRYLLRDAPVAALSNREMNLNGTPRKCLGWRTPTEAFREELMKLR
ncbi:IS30 family transposase [Pseudorhodobacter turbinis]|uniref:IS30 family transposase n=1 Tax=Pseudorhodobacter turbinis TaxID=2500533 RepID=UPI001F10E952|nr:IS30 family transposase [Pseudorhodobacter turbinis]